MPYLGTGIRSGHRQWIAPLKVQHPQADLIIDEFGPRVDLGRTPSHPNQFARLAHDALR